MSFDVARFQQELAGLVDAGDYRGDDRWLHAVAASGRLAILRGSIALWRELRIRRACPLTTALLEEAGTFEGLVAEAAKGGVSPYSETFACAFLDFVASRHDGRIAQAARFEAAMIRHFHGEELTAEDLAALQRDLPR